MLEHVVRAQILDAQGAPRVSHRPRWWLGVLILVLLATGEWLQQASPLWVWSAAALSVVLAGIVLRAPGWPDRILAVLAGLLVGALALTHLQVSRIEHRWPALREQRVTAASERLAGDLRSAFLLAERAAASALDQVDRNQVTAFGRLGRAIPPSGPEVGLSILEATGVPWAWAGRHRLPHAAQGDSIATRWNGYYLLLETRRHSRTGSAAGGERVAVASVLVWAHPAAPDRERSLAELFRRETGVGLEVFPPGLAPDGPDVFDYQEPTTAGPRLLFSVRPVPPDQGEVKERVLSRGSGVVSTILLLLAAGALVWPRRRWERYIILGAALLTAMRSPVGPALGLDSLFSPATFFRSVLGPVSSSVGVLALTGLLVLLVGVALWRRQVPRYAPTMLLGVVSLAIAPYLVRELGRGITPPANGVSMTLWVVWELALLITAAALIAVAAALFRGKGDPARGWRLRIGLGIGLALVATLVGIYIWSPRGGWPPWYTFLWTPALVLVALPAPRLAAITAIALVAGSASALVTWGAVLEGRLEVARRDVASLGAEPDPLAIPILERFGERVTLSQRGASQAALYGLWFGSEPHRQGYPAHLALWSSDGMLQEELPLDSLAISNRIRQELVRTMPPDSARLITEVRQAPGLHSVLLARVDSTSVVTLTLGPRTQLIGPTRVSRLLSRRIEREPLYQLTMSPPAPAVPSETVDRLRWRRTGWTVHGEQAVVLPGGERRVHADLDLRGTVPVLVRGALIVLLNVLVLWLVWAVAELLDGERLPRPNLLRWRGSFRVRLAFTLAGFFVVPAVGFAAWSFGRLEDEARRGRDLVAIQTLRDPAVTSASATLLGQERPQLRDGLSSLSQRLGAELFLYSGGSMVAASAPLLEDLGVVAPLMDPTVFARLAFDRELEATRSGRGAGLAERLAYRVTQTGPPGGFGTLATPQLSWELGLEARQVDLGLVLLLATLVGLTAAILGARLAANALSRPVADLRDAALAIGQGQALPTPAAMPPQEFEPVFGAFDRMASDIRSSQEALDAARRRTATVLATVATGVVGLDTREDVIIANPRAEELLGTALPAGARFDALVGSEWDPVTRAVAAFLSDPRSAPEASEVDIGSRRFSLQLATLGQEPGGVVLALNDITDVSQAERILAWGEMAHQVAHEIKNPLTPMRLGIQHLQRVYRDRGANFDRALSETSDRILAEIDRLDRIARAFGRFAAPADEVSPLDHVDLVAVAQEVIQLYQLAGTGAAVRLEATGPATGAARTDEVKEVLMNLVENARNAAANVITIRVTDRAFEVEDDGRGIPRELMPRVFEPRFSSTTSGAGLGLAIVRRLVESWGATVTIASTVGDGTTVSVHLGGDDRASPTAAT